MNAPFATPSLPPAPAAVLDQHGQPRVGRYAGLVDAFDWRALAAPYARNALWRRFHHKRWQYVALATADVFCGIAIVDVGWTNTAFAYVFDRRQKKVVAGFSQDGLPGLTASLSNRPAQGTHSQFKLLGNEIDYRQLPDSQRYQLRLRVKDFSIDAEFDASDAAPWLLAVGPVDGGSIHGTQKSSGMPAKGEVRLRNGQVYSLAGSVASIDYSNGLLARETRWRWASAHNLQLGFNLQHGYFGTQENVLWLDGQLIALGAAHFAYNAADPLQPWRVSTDDGLLDLHFTPEGARREDKNLGFAASRYVQPVGVFNGWVKAHASATPQAVRNLVGVTEDHFSRW